MNRVIFRFGIGACSRSQISSECNACGRSLVWVVLDVRQCAEDWCQGKLLLTCAQQVAKFLPAALPRIVLTL